MSQPNIEKVPSVEDRSLPVFDEFDEISERIRERAFDLFRYHGFGDGHALDDWLQAEREVCWPAAELAEDDKEFTLRIALAGFDADDITVTANPRELIVKAEQEERKSTLEDSDEKVHFSEFRRENVYRRIALPADADVDKIEAEFKRGLLTIEVPKAPGPKKAAKKVKVSSAA